MRRISYLARISHRISTVAMDLAARPLRFGRVKVLEGSTYRSGTRRLLGPPLALPDGHLRRFATKSREKCGLGVAFAVLSILLSCGESPVNDPTSVTSPIPTDLPQAGAKYQVYLFSAPWCGECTKELTELKSLWLGQTADAQNRMQFKLYVVTGPNKEKPTPEMAEAYKNSLGLTFLTVPDEWWWKTYRSFFPTTWNLPAAVILSEGGNKLKTFIGPPKYTAQELVDAVQTVLGSSK